MTYTEILQGALGGSLATLTIGMIIFSILFVLAVYIYTSLALMAIAKKKKYKYPWLAWIPIANIAMVLQMGGFHWAFIFLIIVPIAGVLAISILSIIATWRIYSSLKYPGWLALSPLIGIIPLPGVSLLGMIASLVILGVVAWGKR